MVYTGKPSRGCGMCKSRRIKCDEKRPTCGNCKKSRRKCPGFPDEFDLVFRDENKAMARKARKASGPVSSTSSSDGSSTQTSPLQFLEHSFEVLARNPSLEDAFTPTDLVPLTPCDSKQDQLILFSPPFQDPSLSHPGDFDIETAYNLDDDDENNHNNNNKSTNTNGTQQLVHIPQFPDPTLDQKSFEAWLWNLEQVPKTIVMAPDYEAVTFFFKNFITLPQQAESTRGYLEFLVPLYNLAMPSSALHLITSAVAMATCGQYPGKQMLLQEAVRTYGKAIRKVNQDLQHWQASKADETVLAILMFALYETIMSTDGTITAWGNHVDGAVTLTKLRGTDQFNNPMSLAMFRAVRTMMITSCVQRSKPIDTFPGTQGWMGTGDMSEENAANRLTLICIDLPNLRARANKLTSSPYSAAEAPEARQILEFAQLVDDNLDAWYRTLPPEWKHRIIGVEGGAIADADLAEAEKWPGEQHVYHDIPLASIMNDYRVCRIFCRRVMLACVEWLGDGGVGVYEQSVFVVQQMVDEISACVPFHMCYDLQPVARESGQEQYAAEAFGGYSLVWPLYVAANAETIPQRQRDWLLGRLSVIGTKFGLSSAQVLVLARRHVLTCGPMFP